MVHGQRQHCSFAIDSALWYLNLKLLIFRNIQRDLAGDRMGSTEYPTDFFFKLVYYRKDSSSPGNILRARDVH